MASESLTRSSWPTAEPARDRLAIAVTALSVLSPTYVAVLDIAEVSV